MNHIAAKHIADAMIDERHRLAEARRQTDRAKQPTAGLPSFLRVVRFLRPARRSARVRTSPTNA